jgi:hypothetical protein
MNHAPEEFTTEAQRHREVGHLEHHSLYAVFQSGRMKVKKQAGLEATQLEVSQQLCFVDRQQSFDGFQFKDEPVIDDNVNPISTIQSYVLVRDRQRDLALKTDLLLSKFITQAFLISGF